MTEEPEVMAFDVDVEQAWTTFGEHLARRLERFDDDDILILELDLPEDDSGALPYVQFLGVRGERLRCEISSNAHLAPEHRLSPDGEELIEGLGFSLDRDDSGEPDGNFATTVDRCWGEMVATQIVAALRRAFGVIHPAMLRELEPSGPGQAELPDPGDLPPIQLDDLYRIDNAWELRVLVHRTLYASLGGRIEPDDDGDWPLVGLGHAPLFVRVDTEEPWIRVWTRVVHDISDADAAVREVNILNRHVKGARFAVRHDALWLSYEIQGSPFLPRHLDTAIRMTAQAASAVAEDFAERSGGRS